MGTVVQGENEKIGENNALSILEQEHGPATQSIKYCCGAATFLQLTK